MVACCRRALRALLLLLALASAALAVASSVAPASAPWPRPSRPPHVVFVLVDDLGHGNAGWTYDFLGGAAGAQGRPRQRPAWIQTPRLDALASREGRPLLRHYVHYSCTPTRSAAQTGRLPVHVTTNLYNPENPAAGAPRNMTGLADKLRAGGYSTAFVGKWDAGMATPQHTPSGRGYDSSLLYFSHKNDFWTQQSMQTECNDKYGLNLTDLWRDDAPATGEAATGRYEEAVFLDEALRVVDSHADGAARAGSPHGMPGGGAAAAANESPLLLFFAPHVAHCPLQVPQDKFDEFRALTGEDDISQCAAQTPYIYPGSGGGPSVMRCKAQYAAMVKTLDDSVGALVDKLKARGMWEDTLLVLTSDNGGPVLLDESAATNFPLRGGKYTPLEGGVRAAALVAGGAVPVAVRGTPVVAPIHVADWYTTLCALAGVDHTDTRAAQWGLPPVDGIDQWDAIASPASPLRWPVSQPAPARRVLSSSLVEGPLRLRAEQGVSATAMAVADGYAASLRSELASGREIPLDGDTLLVGDLKLHNSSDIHFAVVQPPDFPNASSTDIRHFVQDCGSKGGCLYDVANDPSELVDLSASMPDIVDAMLARLAQLRRGFFENAETGADDCPSDTAGMPCACWAGVHRWGGFMGPYQSGAF